MFPVLSANNSGSYVIPKSLRFRSSASAYLNRTPASAGNRQTWTYSVWHKRGQLGSSYSWLMNAYNTTQDALDFSADRLDFFLADAVSIRLTSTSVYRDPSAWYHIVLAFDSTQATASNRIKMYVNGIQLTSFSTANYPSQNYQCPNINNTVQNEIGYVSGGIDGYMAEVNFIDGQALTPSSFGAFDATSGVWQPTKYSGTYGTNGFYLKFSDTTSTTTLCYDYSGNSNNWTPNNISLTAGSTYDSMLDSPTNYDNGGNGVGNYAVLNPLAGISGTVADGNLGLTTSTSDYSTRISTIGVTAGKWYFEATQLSYSGNNQPAVAIVNPSFAITGDLGAANSWAYYGRDGNKYTSGSGSAYGATYGNNDVIGVAFDADAGTLTFYKNNTSQGTAFTGLTSGPYFFAIGDTQGSSSSVFVVNFGQRPFAYTPPTGFKALNTQNLSAPSIVNGASYMAATPYTGVSGGGSVVNSVNGIGFQPDFVWMKCRSVARNHELADSVRGTPYALFSNLTNAEVSDTRVSSFNSNGFNYGANSNSANAGDTFIGWQWKAGGTAVTNTAGSITSQVSANTTAGFSVVTYTGTGANATVGHSLGIAPSMVIVKARANATGWVVGHAYLNGGSSPWNYYLSLESTAAQGSTNLTWNNTAPTSSVFSLGSGSGTNPSSTMVAYCFAAIPGYSAFGSYTGNGSADGPFVFLGFRPRWIMIKLTSASGENWEIYDTSRGPYNLYTPDLYANLSNAEGTNSNRFDILSNGLKIRSANGGVNNSGGTYIYAAFAENPFKISRAR